MFKLGRPRLVIAWPLAAVMLVCSHDARAAGGAYAVDTSEISEAGSCKIETWASWADNTDRVQVANPSCVVDIFRPVELSTQIYNARADGEWNTTLTPKAKTKIIPTEIGKFGLAISASATYDMMTRENTQININVPATLRLSNVVRINVNAGWQWDRILDRHYVTYGVGVDWRTPDNVWTWTGEIFGQAGADHPDVPTTVTQPRFQTGIRWRPIDVFSIDFIYGRNIYGENANWFTVAAIRRFPVPGGKGGE
jgi:hypothetical protein